MDVNNHNSKDMHHNVYNYYKVVKILYPEQALTLSRCL